MKEIITSVFSSLSPELSTFLISMIPVGELRFSIPWAVKMYNFSPEKAFAISLAGNILISLLVYLLISPVADRLECKGKYLGKLVCWLRTRAHKKGEKSFSRWGSWGLFLLVAIPLPGTGGWTGAMVGAFLGISPRNAIPAITGGVIAAGILILASVKGVVKFF